MKTIVFSYKMLIAVFFTLFAGNFILPADVSGQTTGDYYSIVARQDRYYDSLISIRGVNNMKGTGDESNNR